VGVGQSLIVHLQDMLAGHYVTIPITGIIMTALERLFIAVVGIN
jgi:hypothetical protein